LGGEKKEKDALFSEIKDIMRAGATGLAVGRNVWQSKNPVKIAKEIKNIVCGR
jgi:DhnA family fructose-bisphosphate aldolase class Ia